MTAPTYLTVRRDAAAAAVRLAVISDRSAAPPDSYLGKLRSVEGQRVPVLNVFRGPSGLPTGYTVSTPSGSIHLRPLLAVEDEPVEHGHDA